jgi:hypothetical protein
MKQSDLSRFPNAHHRPLMRNVIEELTFANNKCLQPFTQEIITCFTCGDSFNEYSIEDINTFRRKKILGYCRVFCGDWCEYDEDTSARKAWRRHRWNTDYKSLIRIHLTRHNQ